MKVARLYQISLCSLLCVLGLLFFTFVAVVLSDDATWISEWLGTTTKLDALEFLGISMGGILLAVQGMISHRRARAMEDTAEAQAAATDRQAEANEVASVGQLHERLKAAIEHLGHESASVRLGGAYELFHLASHTVEMRRTALDVLCAHIRRVTGEDGYREQYESRPSAEIQSVLTLLFVRSHEMFLGLEANLRGSWLGGASLYKARLSKVLIWQTPTCEMRSLPKPGCRAATFWGRRCSRQILHTCASTVPT